MPEDTVKQVMINNRMIGIIGWENALDKAKTTCAGKNDEDIAAFLITAVAAKNYVPSSARDAYGHALLREYKIACNLSIDPELPTGLNILVLGMGCARCDQLQSDIRDVLSEMQIAADLRHVTDMKEIASWGILGAPALVVNKKVVSVGQVPPKSSIRRWITEACTEIGT